MDTQLPVETQIDIENLMFAINEAAILAVTDSKGVITYVNDRFCKISGYSKAELIGQTHQIVRSDHHPRQFFQNLWQTISAGKVWTGQICNRAKAGQHYWVDTVIVPFLDAQKKPYQYVAIRYEVTEKKEVELKLQSLLDSTFEGLMIYNVEGQVIEANRTALDLLGQARERVIGASVEELFTGALQPFEIGPRNIMLSLDGGTKSQHFDVSVKPYIHLGSRAFLIGLVDVTEKRSLEALILQQDRLATAGFVASSLAHEFGSPMGVGRGRAEMVMMALESEKSPSPQIKTSMEVIVQQIDRITKLIQSMLNLTRTQSNAQISLVSIEPLIRDVLELMVVEFSKNQIQVELDLDLSAKAMTTPHAFFQVLLNLVVNSVHSLCEKKEKNPAFSGQIWLTAKTQAGQTRLSVRDNGVGIEKANQSKLFVPFFTTKPVGKGTGLGLATALKIVQSWGGRITVKSEPSEYAEFTLELRASAP